MKILFIVDRYPPNISQNGNIVNNIVNVFLKNNDFVVCLTKNIIDKKVNSSYAENIHTINPSYWDIITEKKSMGCITSYEICLYYLLVYLRKIWLAFHYKMYPNSAPITTKKFIIKAKALHEKYRFDCIIGVFRPFSTISTVIEMKSIFPELICGAYYLDLFEPINRPKFMPKNMYSNLSTKGNIKAFKNLDFILLPKTSKNIFDNKLYYSYRCKMHFVDFPAFIFREELFSKKNVSDQTLKLVYTGTLDKSYRNPMYLLKILEELHRRGISFSVEFYGKCNCKDEIARFALNSSYEIKHFGMVPKEEADKKLYEADFLINISNDLENMVPSKIFELFASGKPIINYITRQSDPSFKYFEKYPAQITLKSWKSINEQVDKLVEFLQASLNFKYDPQIIKSTYWENTPEYIVNLLKGIILADLKFKS